MRILVVEDEPDMAMLLTSRLAASGFIADSVGNGTDAELAVSTVAYGVALVDRRLPDGDGAALIGRLRLRSPGLPVILITALDAVAHRVAGLDAGADDYIVKPFDNDELLARIRAALRRPGAAVSPSVVCGQSVYADVNLQFWRL